MSAEVPEEEQAMVDPSMHRVENTASTASGKRSGEESMAIVAGDVERGEEALSDIISGDTSEIKPQESQPAQVAEVAVPALAAKPEAIKVNADAKTQPESASVGVDSAQNIPAVATPEAAPKYDGAGMRVSWPGKEEWKDGDAALKMTDAQLAADYAFKYLTAKANPGHPQIKDNAKEYIETYEKIILAGGEGAELVKRCADQLQDARDKGDNRTYAAISRELTNEAGALKS